MLPPSGNPFKCHEEFLYFCSLVGSHLLNVLTFFHLTGGYSEGLDAFRFFCRNTIRKEKSHDVPLSMCVCMCFLPIHFGHQVRWTYQPGSHRRKVTHNFSSPFFLRCVPYFFSREGFSLSLPSSTVKSNTKRKRQCNGTKNTRKKPRLQTNNREKERNMYGNRGACVSKND